MVSELRVLGVQVPNRSSESAAHYLRFRRATDRYVAAYAANLAYRREAIRSTYNLFTPRLEQHRAAAVGTAAVRVERRDGA